MTFSLRYGTSHLYNLISLQPPCSTRSSAAVTLYRPPTVFSLKITYCPLRHASQKQLQMWCNRCGLYLNAMHSLPNLGLSEYTDRKGGLHKAWRSFVYVRVWQYCNIIGLRWLHILQKDDSKWVHSVWILYIQGSRPSRPKRAGEMQWHYITLKHLLVFTSIIQ